MTYEIIVSLATLILLAIQAYCLYSYRVFFRKSNKIIDAMMELNKEIREKLTVEPSHEFPIKLMDEHKIAFMEILKMERKIKYLPIKRYLSIWLVVPIIVLNFSTYFIGY